MLDQFLHFCVRAQMAAMLHLPTLLHVAAGTSAPKRLVGGLEACQKLQPKDSVLAQL